ncbi:MAG: hypothetical protein R3E31_15745 [Chloroflexota bacterium]|nr:hypothetical protein [Anaerolineales bacterium]MCB8966140.1 hypothetical protein [Ardenticatenaceae bacterium]
MKFDTFMNNLLDKLSSFFAGMPGLLPIIGLLFVIINFILQIFPGPGSSWFVDSNFLLHIGVIITIVGMLLIRALSRD